MSRIDLMIEELNSVRVGKNRAWIFNEDGTLANNIITIDTVELLKYLKYYEVHIPMGEDNDYILVTYIAEKVNSGEWTKGNSDNTYNWNSPISNDLNLDFYYNKDNECYVLLMAHISGDVRGNYTNYTLLRFDNIDEFYETLCDYDSCISFEIEGKTYMATPQVLSETYSVYCSELGCDVGEFCGCEVDDIKDEIIKETERVIEELKDRGCVNE